MRKNSPKPRPTAKADQTTPTPAPSLRPARSVAADRDGPSAADRGADPSPIGAAGHTPPPRERSPR